MKVVCSKLLKSFLVIVLIVGLLNLFCGCEKENDPYENKLCIQCGDKATHYASGTKPVDGSANEDNCEKVNASIYRIFYCDACWESIPKAQLKP